MGGGNGRGHTTVARFRVYVGAQPRERLALSSVIPSVPRRAPPATSYKVLNFALVPPLSTIAHAYIAVEWPAERSKVVVCHKDSSVRLC